MKEIRNFGIFYLTAWNLYTKKKFLVCDKDVSSEYFFFKKEDWVFEIGVRGWGREAPILSTLVNDLSTFKHWS